MISVDYVSLRVTRKKIDRSTVPFKVRIIPVLAVLMVIWLSAAFQIEASIRPSDIEGCWAEEAILALVNEGIITGYPDGTFKPEDPVTRAEFSKMIAKAFAIRAAGEPVFSDIEGNWAEAYIAALTEAGIVSGFPDGTFRPLRDISRAEMTEILIRTIKLGDKMDKLKQPSPSFIDVDHDHWAFHSIEVANTLGVLPVYFGVVFEPDLPSTRAETAYMIQSLIGLRIYEGELAKVDNQQGTLTVTTRGGIEQRIIVPLDTAIYRNNVEAGLERLLRGDEVYVVSDSVGQPKFIKARGLVTKDDVTAKVSILSKGALEPKDVEALARSDWNTVREDLEPKLLQNMVEKGLTEEEASVILKQNWSELGELAKKRVAGALSSELGISQELIISLFDLDWEQAKAYGQIEVAQYVLMRLLNL
ncbi:MAG: S-layer homology domain-containing protein [Firmicutes bacterium]|nr:S-layer homology domain-containing protein [Bacillota bacterium]